MAAVWGDHPPRTALASLHNLFARLRSLLGPESRRLQRNRGSYSLRLCPGELDAEVFSTHLVCAQDILRARDWETVEKESAAALSLWRGRPVAEFPSLHGAPEVAHLVEHHLQAVEMRFEAHLRTDRHREVTADIAHYAATHPLREPFHRQLITALHQGERTADAITAYPQPAPFPGRRTRHRPRPGHPASLPQGARPGFTSRRPGQLARTGSSADSLTPAECHPPRRCSRGFGARPRDSVPDPP
ncbi:BTAD domain-containing putative transcriptional regulator [Streptomyces sp. SJL17-1]|uniref:AfsR/SARP family transcriptional regulator n=1 Tax=Streptomyces sp. SJL17-1 TaxID=2967223 RepID=UPI00398F9E13